MKVPVRQGVPTRSDRAGISVRIAPHIKPTRAAQLNAVNQDSLAGSNVNLEANG